MSKRVPKCGVFAFKRQRGWPRYKRRPVLEGVALHASKKGGGLKEEHHCKKYKKCKTVVFRVVVPLNKKPPKKCIKEVEDARA